MFNNVKNTKKQGDIGMGMAIGYFTAQGYTVLIPLTDSQDYDLVIEKNGLLKKVQVKTTSYKTPNGIFNINLSVKGGNRSYNTIKKFNPDLVDYLFIFTSNGDMYFIPSPQNITSHLNLGKKYQDFKVFMDG
jgi:hypothetical protein